LNNRDDVIIPTPANVVYDAPSSSFDQEGNDELNKINNEKNINIGVENSLDVGKFLINKPFESRMSVAKMALHTCKHAYSLQRNCHKELKTTLL